MGFMTFPFLNAMPNMIITQPRNGHVLKELLESAFSWGRPAAIRYPNAATEDSTEQLCYREAGKAEILAEGSDILIIALGHMNGTAMKVREILAQRQVHATVMDPVFVKPLDSDLICKLLLTHQRIVTLEEHSVVSGMGSIINNFLMSQGYSNVQVLNLGIPETFVEHGSNNELLNELGLTPDKIAHRISIHFGLSKTPSMTNLLGNV